MAHNEKDGQDEATLPWNMCTLVQEVFHRKGGGISDNMIPGGQATANEAIKQGLLKLGHKDKTTNYFQLTFNGLLYCWEQAGPDEQWLAYAVV